MTTEEILYKTSRTGTTVFYFVPNISEGQIPDLVDLTWVTLNGNGAPLEYGYFKDSNEIWINKLVNSYYINSQLSATSTIHITGYSKVEIFNTKIEDNQKANIKSKFTNGVSEVYKNEIIQFNNNASEDLKSSLLDPLATSSQIRSSSEFITQQNSNSTSILLTPIVIFNNALIDDMFANIKLSRTFETLDTLKVYNKTINSIPSQESSTGILYGKLEAKQLIKDSKGNNIKIPLRNVPIGIFNPDDEFPTPSSINDDGDRMFLNIKENAKNDLYFDSIAYELDQNFLRSASQFNTVPSKFKHITITNDNGEFFIYDAPIGNKILVFEVDLFKQGLTYDEIVLNNFPFPINEGISNGQLPCYYYNQVPVDIVSTWGTNQTGYTELDVSVNLDLRKWTTYIFAPGAFGKEKLEITTAKNAANTLKIEVRDMTLEGFPTKSVTVAQIADDLDRKPNSRYNWTNEFTDQKSKLQYDQFGCHVLKLPANLYDPNGYRTDLDGVPTNQKGVWLTAYQFKTYINEVICYRTTGGFLNPGNNFFYSHFDLNYTGSITGNGTAPIFGLGLGTSIYSKPWSISFPEPYKITKKPIAQRYFGGDQRTIKSPYIVEEPWYSDGDLVGVMVDPASGNSANAGGFGLQNSVTFGNYVINRIGQVATKNYMYKYEKEVAWNETYANGFQPFWTQARKGPYDSTTPNDPKMLLAGMSSVNNGEKYQRLECGYGYFMKYREWPRVFKIEWGADFYYMPDTMWADGPTGNKGALDGPEDNPGPGYTLPQTYNNNGFSSYQPWINQIYNLENKNIVFAFNNKTVRRNTIDIYRIVKSGTDNISIPQNFVILTATRIDFGHVNRAYSVKITNAGEIDSVMINRFNDRIWIEGGGISARYISPGDSFTLKPNSYIVIDETTREGFKQDVNYCLDYTVITFPGNASFNVETNKYEKANYNFRLLVNGKVEKDSKRFNDAGEALTFTNYPPQLSLVAKIAPDTHAFYSRQYVDDKESQGINVDGQAKKNDNRIYSMILT